MEAISLMKVREAQDVRQWAQTGAAKPAGPGMTDQSTIGAAQKTFASKRRATKKAAGRAKSA